MTRNVRYLLPLFHCEGIDLFSADPEAQYRGVFVPSMKLPLHVTRTLKLSPFQRSRQILLAGTLADAVKGCDTYAKSQAAPGNMYLG